MAGRTDYVSGITLKSVPACLLALLLTAVLTQYFDIIVELTFASEHTLALPAIWAVFVLLLVSALMFGLFRFKILNRQELLCVLFFCLIAAPLMTQGFWHRYVAIIATNPMMGDFEKMDALSDRLWPHGANLIEDILSDEGKGIDRSGSVEWESIEYEEDRIEKIPVIVNEDQSARSAIRFRLPLEKDGRAFVVPGEPYMISVLARATALGPDTFYFCRVYNDEETVFTEFFNTTEPEKKTFLHRKGFVRVGSYGVKFSTAAREYVTVELGLSGDGRLELADPKLFSVAALEGLYKGKKLVTETEYAALPAAQRANLIVKPDNMWSPAGVRFLLSGYIPVRDWVVPMTTWTSFILFLLLAMFAVNVIMRRQWMDSERFQLPVTRIPLALIDDEGKNDAAVPPIWKNRIMWIGMAVGLFWMLMKAWHFYNPKVPDLTVRVALADYFNDPGWGKTWENCRFEIVGIFFAMCIFMELNVLLSLVLGYFLFRYQFWIGEMSGLTTDPNYPYQNEQAISAYVTYALIVLVFARKHIWRVLKAAARGDRKASEGEAMSYRTAVIVLVLCLAASMVWAGRVGIAPPAMLLFMLFLLSVGLVAAKLRAECGTPWGYFVPGNLALFMVLLGGIASFGGEMMMFSYIASFMLAPTVFYLIPGAQLEFLELGRRWQVKPRQIMWVSIGAVLGGMILGGWVFLSNGYALGGETMRYRWAFDTKLWYFFSYNQDMNMATRGYLGQDAATAQGMNPAWIAVGLTGLLTAAVSILRQAFAGFWFHPIGIVFASTNFINYIWGSALTAWVVRMIVLRLGGAATVRNKLHPFFVGFFVGCVLSYLIIGSHAAYLQSIGIEQIYPILKSAQAS